MERYFNQMTNFDMEDFLEWMHKYNLLDEYYSLQNQIIFNRSISKIKDAIFKIIIKIHTDPRTGPKVINCIPRDVIHLAIGY